MKTWILLILSYCGLSLAGQEPIILGSSPSLSPDGSTLVFEWRKDIWQAPSSGGQATRLISHPAHDALPLIGPFGEMLYFCSYRNGSRQIYKRPLKGGPVTQVTFHSENSALEDIASDGTRLLITGHRDQNSSDGSLRMIEIDLTQDAPEKILLDSFADAPVYSPDGSRILFTQGGDKRYRQGYKGSKASKIYQLDLKSGEVTPVIEKMTESRSPMWMPDGSGFYYTDGSHALRNITAHTLSDHSEYPLTSIDDAVIVQPSLSRNGEVMVFRAGGHFFTFKIGSQPTQLKLWHTEDLPDISVETVKVNSTSDADFSSSGLEIIFSEAGELWAMDTILKEPVRLTDTPAYETNALFSQGAESIFYIKDDGIHADIYQARRRNSERFWWQKNSLTHQALTTSQSPKSKLSLNPMKTHMAWIENNGTLVTAKVDGTERTELTNSWDSPTYSWSPDGKWIAYSIENDNFNSDVWIIPSDGSAPAINVSRHPDDEINPVWSPDGCYLAFKGRRHGSEWDIFYIPLTLKKAEETAHDKKRKEALKKMQEDPLYQTDAQDEESIYKEEVKEAHSAGEDLANTENPLATKIDFEDIHTRVRRIDLQDTPDRITWNSDSESILYQHEDSLYSIGLKEDDSPEEIIPEGGNIIRVESNNLIYWINNNKPARMEDGENTAYNFTVYFERKRSDYLRQAIRLIWRKIGNVYYDPSLNNLDWPKILEKYEDRAVAAHSNSAFTRVANMLLGELNGSHMGFNSSRRWPRTRPGPKHPHLQLTHLGARFDRSHTGPGLKISDIVPESPASEKKSLLEPGELIMKIDGVEAQGNTPLHKLLTGPLDRDIELIVHNKKGVEREVIIRPISYRLCRRLTKEAQIEERAQYVKEHSQGELGYIHVTRMAWDEFEKFERKIFEEGYGREGLIIDVRNNGGGFTADHLLTVLNPPRFAATVPRGGGIGYPHGRRVYATWHKPIVVLCNQNSYSNAEIFTHAIKDLKRGKVVGVPTAGGVISTGSTRILDIGRMRVPFRGWFLNKDGQDMELNGAIPDIIVQAKVGKNGAENDTQLIKAMEVLKKDIQTSKKNALPNPKYRSELN